MGDLPYLQPTLYPGGFDSFSPLVVSRGYASTKRCPFCGCLLVAFSEGTTNHETVVCPDWYRQRGRRHHGRNLQRLAHHFRQLRCFGLVANHSDWEENWPESAFAFGLVRRVNPRAGDALQPSTIRCYASDGAFTIRGKRQEMEALGRPPIHCLESVHPHLSRTLRYAWNGGSTWGAWHGGDYRSETDGASAVLAHLAKMGAADEEP